MKLGIGYVTDQVMESIQAGLMSREDGLELVKKYDGKCHSKYISKLCRYLEIHEEYFLEKLENIRNREIWELDEDGNWVLDCEE